MKTSVIPNKIGTGAILFYIQCTNEIMIGGFILIASPLVVAATRSLALATAVCLGQLWRRFQIDRPTNNRFTVKKGVVLDS